MKLDHRKSTYILRAHQREGQSLADEGLPNSRWSLKSETVTCLLAVNPLSNNSFYLTLCLLMTMNSII